LWQDEDMAGKNLIWKTKSYFRKSWNNITKEVYNCF
jgi:hypothetical protein